MAKVAAHDLQAPLPANDQKMLVLVRRDVLEALVTAAIAALDEADGEADAEANGDELDGTNAEDEIGTGQFWERGAGCPIADPGGCEHDGSEPDHDAEIETWAHPDDHPAELFRGKRQ